MEDALAGLRRLPRNASIGMRRVPSLVGRRRQVAWHKKVSASNQVALYAPSIDHPENWTAVGNDDRPAKAEPSKG